MINFQRITSKPISIPFPSVSRQQIAEEAGLARPHIHLGLRREMGILKPNNQIFGFRLLQGVKICLTIFITAFDLGSCHLKGSRNEMEIFTYMMIVRQLNLNLQIHVF